MSVRTRFAPSPTGALHLGGARTAYFNWLYARKNGGQFFVRIEDTDGVRNDYSNVPDLLGMLEWLGLDNDGVSYQSSSAARHVGVALELEQRGAAYRCYMTSEELQVQREQKGCVHSPWRDRCEVLDQPYTIRLRVPSDDRCMVPDTLRGKVCVQCSALDDMVLLRSDGKPTYILASAVDDHDADITHVIRGDEHLTNSARQSLIYRAMGWTMPVLTHIPMVCDADGNKLSKRSGAQSIAGLRDAGYLPEAVLNAALRTGWARGDEEVVPVKRALEIFELGGLNKSAARFDGAKLDYLNAVYMRQHADLWSIVQPMLVGWSEHECRRARILLPEVAKRSSTLVEILGGLAYCRDDFCGGAGGMDGLCDALRSADFSAEGIEVALRRFATTSGIGMRDLAQSIRVAITGSDVSPSLFFMLSALGRDLVLKRLCKE